MAGFLVSILTRPVRLTDGEAKQARVDVPQECRAALEEE